MSTTSALDREFETLEEPHQLRETTARNHNAHGEQYDLKERGFFCAECGAKATLGTDGVTEYGHYGCCPHRNVERKPSGRKVLE